ncbi:MAG TPA: outer membrane protein [Beijerinckiaceae bacterium]|nr:outer membrane protein [Beijerinckiaceae bacterium]
MPARILWTNDTPTVTNVFFVPPLTFASVNQNGSGVVGGLVTGFNWQLSNAFVVGLEGDLEGTSIRASTNAYTNLPGGAVTTGQAITREALPWQASLRARLGFAAGDALFYGTGGIAFGEIETRYSWVAPPFPPPNVDSFSRTKVGWTLGAGVEYALNANWAARAEYRYTSFGKFTDPLLNSSLGAIPANLARHDLAENTVRVGIVYLFNASQPVAARY